MAQTYTLDEAATRLGMSSEEFKRRLKDEWKSIRSFRDGATLRFRSADIDELARSLGQASDPGLQLGAPGSGPQSGSSEELLLADPPRSSFDDDDSAIGTDDIFTLAAGDSGRSKRSKSSDSDVRLEVSNRPKDDADSSVQTDEISLDLGESKDSSSGSSTKLRAPKSGPNLSGPGSNKIPGPPVSSSDLMSGDSSSEFELSLDADSGSFELQLTGDSSEEIPLGTSEPASQKGQSGINLDKPADSGVSLESDGTPLDDSDDFELSLDASDPGGLSGGDSAIGGHKAASSSDSEFELTLDDSSGIVDHLAAELEEEGQKGDIFETDFELPAVDDSDSGSEVVAVESSDTDLENSDFDLALDESDAPVEDESESQVVLLDDEDDSAPAPQPLAASRQRRPVVLDDDASSALRDVPRDVDEDEEVDTVPAARGGVAPPAPWGPLPAIVLIPCLIFTFLGGVMTFEILQGMRGYSQGSQPSGLIVRGFASMLDMDPKD